MSSGIYKIYSTEKPMLYYIGSSIDVQSRKANHFCLLRANRHHSKFMQEVFNECGEQSFRFEIIEYCRPSDLLLREQAYLSRLLPAFNTCLRAGSRAGVHHTPATKIRLSKLMKKARRPSRSEALRGRFLKRAL